MYQKNNNTAIQILANTCACENAVASGIDILDGGNAHHCVIIISSIRIHCSYMHIPHCERFI